MADSSNGSPFDDLDIPPSPQEESVQQAQAGLLMIAQSLHIFFTALTNHGFTRAEAMRIVVEWGRGNGIFGAPKKGG